MKKTILKVICATAAAAIAPPALATSGKLNSQGCHNSKKAGYHCHKAQPAKDKVSPAKPKTANSSPTSSTATPKK